MFRAEPRRCWVARCGGTEDLCDRLTALRGNSSQSRGRERGAMMIKAEPDWDAAAG